jgi:hypothetical protein
MFPGNRKEESQDIREVKNGSGLVKSKPLLFYVK